MIRVEVGELVISLKWVLVVLRYLFMGMKNDESQNQQNQNQHQHLQGVGPRSARANGFISNSFRAFSSYLRIVSSGASSVARSAASVASSIVDKDDDVNCDQVNWAGFDKLEGQGCSIQRVLLLGYRSGFQVWDVEEANNVRDLVSKHDGSVSFMQMLPRPALSKTSEDRLRESRPLLVLCADVSVSTGSNLHDGLSTPGNVAVSNVPDLPNGSFSPTIVRFYSLRSQSYVHEVKFRSAVYSVRCSSRVVAISQAAQIHCFNSLSLEREYTILTNPIVAGYPGSGGIGCGPLAVGPRWLAYSGSPTITSNSGHVSPQHLTNSASFPGFSQNGSLVAHYAKESSKQLAAGIMCLGDKGYRKLSRYCSELLPDSNNISQSGTRLKANGTLNGHLTDSDNVGMIIVRDIVSKAVIAQFRAHRSSISALCFDPSGTLLVTASVQGHNINVFKIMPGGSGISSTSPQNYASCIHLYRLQRGLTNAVIRDISFSDDSNWIMISSSRGTSHLFTLNPIGGSVNLHSADSSFTAKNGGLGVTTKLPASGPPTQLGPNATGPPVTLSAVSRIRSGNNGWTGTVTGAAAAATGRISSLPGAIASSFHNCKSDDTLYGDNDSLSKAKFHLLVFSPSGSMIQYALRVGLDFSMMDLSGLNNAHETAGLECDARLGVEAIQKWNICQKQNRREVEDNIDIYGDNKHFEVKEKPKISMDEKHHLYISEAELQMHEQQTPLWANPKVSFQLIKGDAIEVDEENKLGGETEIERIPARMIEVRSKNLIPVYEYLHHPRFIQTSSQASEGSIGRMLDQNGIDKTSQSTSETVLETKGITVNNDDDFETQKTQLKNVHNSESSKIVTQVKVVNNNNKQVLKMENHFEDEGDEFD